MRTFKTDSKVLREIKFTITNDNNNGGPLSDNN